MISILSFFFFLFSLKTSFLMMLDHRTNLILHNKFYIQCNPSFNFKPAF